MRRPPPPPKEPSGCIQTIVITKVILQILFIPLMMILSGIVAVVLTIFAFSYHPLIGLAVLAGWGILVVALGKWEWRRVGKEMDLDDHR
jgi:uncharacterized membrane protein